MMGRRTSIDADVVVVGAGVVGCSIAWRLSKQKLRVIVVESRHDVGLGASSANSGIISSGWTLPRGSLISRLTVAANTRWDELSDQLCVPFRRCGSVVLMRSEEERARLPGVVEQARLDGITTVVGALDVDEIRKRAPHATEHCYGGILLDEGIIDSPRLTVAFAELAATNGVRFFFREPLVGARREMGCVREIYTPSLSVRVGYVVNAAGLGGDVVSDILGCEQFRMLPKQGEYLVFDREFGRAATCILEKMPTDTHGLMIIPTVHGGLLVGPTADDVEDKTDVSTHRGVLQHVLAEGRELMPSLDEQYVIKTYAGNRPHSEDGLYRIGPSGLAPNVVQVAAIRSVGVSASPALADHVFELLVDQGLQAPVRHDAQHRLDRPKPLFETLDCCRAAEDRLGRTIVCACEKVTAAEIHAAFQSPVPARSLVGLAHRTHATYGRCQGATCGAGVAFIASLYLKGEPWQLPVGEPDATLGVGMASHE